MDNLKKIFSCSSDIVIITDYMFNILWRNKADRIFSYGCDNCSELFKNEKSPLESGTYYVKHTGLVFECRIIVYPECEGGVYIIQTSGDDVVFQAIKCRTIRELAENYSGNYREYTMGINLANSVLREIIIDNHLYDKLRYSDIISGDCCKMLKTPTNITELIQYVNGSINVKRINILNAFSEFSKKSNKVLKEKAEIKINIQPDLYINADADRLEVFFMALIAVVNGGNAENNIINISAVQISEKDGEKVSITVFPDSIGTDIQNKTFSEKTEMHKGDETDLNLSIINRFCLTFNGIPFILGNSDELKSFGIKFPICENNDDIIKEEPIKLETPQKKYQDNMFSKYHIMYSDILY